MKIFIEELLCDKNIKYLNHKYLNEEQNEKEFQNFKIFIDASFFDEVHLNLIKFFYCLF